MLGDLVFPNGHGGFAECPFETSKFTRGRFQGVDEGVSFDVPVRKQPPHLVRLAVVFGIPWSLRTGIPGHWHDWVVEVGLASWRKRKPDVLSPRKERGVW
jgi:hypothetical protein